jgi:hypothetical protein
VAGRRERHREVAVSPKDVTTWKRALLVYSGAAALLPIVMIGWFTRAAISSIEAKASAAVAEVRGSVELVRLAQATHEAKDDAREFALAGRVTRVEDRQDDLETRLAGWRVRMDALPADRRRPRTLAPMGTEGTP